MGHTQKNGAAVKVIKEFISNPTRAQHTLSAAGTVIKLIPDSEHLVRRNGMQCMRYPITKLLDGFEQRWHINSVFNEPPKKEIAWCKIRRTG
jgi:hypothetical protein